MNKIIDFTFFLRALHSVILVCTSLRQASFCYTDSELLITKIPGELIIQSFQIFIRDNFSTIYVSLIYIHLLLCTIFLYGVQTNYS